jgi:hypothetical protein
VQRVFNVQRPEAVLDIGCAHAHGLLLDQVLHNRPRGAVEEPPFKTVAISQLFSSQRLTTRTQESGLGTSSLGPQRNHRIDSRRASSRDKRGARGPEQQRDRQYEVDERVRWIDFKQRLAH